MNTSKLLELLGGERNAERVLGHNPRNWSATVPVRAERAARKAFRELDATNKEAVLELFGGAQNTARVCGISHQAVYKWPARLPESAEKKVQNALKDFAKMSGRSR